MKTYIPTFNFVTCPVNEIERIVYTAQVIMDGFYERKRFSILPNVRKIGNPTSVIFPESKYSQINNFWKRVGRLSRSIPMDIPKDISDFINESIEPLDVKDIENISKQWNAKERVFWNYINPIFKHRLKLINKIEVRITSYGTICSYEPMRTRKDQTLLINLRKDADISHIAEAILTAILRHYKKGHVYSWEELEASVDIFMQSVFGNLFPHYKPTLPYLRIHRHFDLTSSDKYLKKLGVPIRQKNFEVINNELFINNQSAYKFMSAREEKVLRLLIDKNETVVTFDEIADCLWGEDKYISLYAINKSIQRLRKKLTNLGIPENNLQTLRKRGYILNV